MRYTELLERELSEAHAALAIAIHDRLGEEMQADAEMWIEDVMLEIEKANEEEPAEMFPGEFRPLC